jgi:single-strand DNA-binding protein
MNICIFLGRLVRKPELEKVGDTHVTKFSIAVNRKYKTQGEVKEEVNFLDMVAWDKGAESICNFFDKGDAIILYTSAKHETWTDSQTNKARSKVVFRVERFEFPPNGNRSKNESTPSEPTTTENPSGNITQDEIPF